MLYLYLDETENRLHCVSNKPINNGHFLNQEHHTELIVPDNFVYQKSVVDINGKNSFEDLSAQEILDKVTYTERRAAEYPSIVDQLDTLYHGGYDAWKASIDLIKNKYPKT